MSQKILNLLAKKLKEQQIIIDILPINIISKPEKKSAQTLAICNRTLHFLQNNTYKRAVKIENIKLITLSVFSNQLIFHCNEEDVWLQSYHNIKIITNLFKIRQQVFNQPTLTACLEKEKSLANYIVQQSKIKKFWHGMFSKKSPQKEEQKMLQRKSFQTIQIKDKNFVVQLSKTIYRHHYKNVQLLHISGQNGFIFNQYEYHKQEISQTEILYQHLQTEEYAVMRKIRKGSIEQNNKKMRRYLQNYKLQDYNEQILFAIQTVNFYQIITPYISQQKTLEHLINQQECISQIDLLSIFYKLMSFIINNFNILHSLSPKQILIKDTILVSSLFCINPQEINISYLSPEEIDVTLSEKMDVQTINLWKIGMLLYQAAFNTLPFPIQYLAQTIASRRKLELKYPTNNRTLAFKEFLTCLLEIHPQKRGGKNWQKSIFNHKWVLKCMK